MECEKLPKCIFFNDQMESMPAVADLLKNQYCRSAFAECARFRVASRLGASAVPGNMYPGDMDRADALINGAG
jgi:hypothetical protein